MMKRKRTHSFPSLDQSISIRFFDGAEKNDQCGAGMILQIKSDHIIYLKMGVGIGTNTKAKLLSLWGLLWFALKRGVFII